MEPAAQPPSYDELVAALAERGARLARQAVLIREGVEREAVLRARNVDADGRAAAQDARIAALEALVADLARKLGKDSQNSSKPPGSDGPGSRAERRRNERERRRSEPAEGPKAQKKKPGGQPGHAGGGLAFTATPDEVKVVEPGPCGGCGAGLAGAEQVAARPVQVVDIPEIRALATEFLLVSRRCGCGAVTRAEPPAGAVGGPVCYGPNLTASALLLHAFGQLGQERTAEAVNGLFGTAVSTGWINKIAGRFAESLRGFEADAKAALLTEHVLLADETPANTAADSPADDGLPADAPARPFKGCVFTLRSDTIVWLGAGHTRGHAALDLFDLFGRYTGTLVTDDWSGYLKYEANLRARQLCTAHLIRSLRGVADEGGQAWATAMIEALRAGRRTVKAAAAAGHTALDAGQIASLRERYTELAQAGIALNKARRKADGGRHPGWVLARRLLDKIDQVLHHLADFAVPWTSNLAEQALRHVKVHLKISGCFRTLATTRAYCRVHSYLLTIRLHGVPPMQAIRDALAGRAWTPLQPVTAP